MAFQGKSRAGGITGNGDLLIFQTIRAFRVGTCEAEMPRPLIVGSCLPGSDVTLAGCDCG
jgi:hypothetical protein